MNISELVGEKLPEIKKLLFTEETVEAPATETELKFEDAKLVDGTIVRIEPAVEVGAKVSVISEDGETVDAPDGEHELEEGTVVRTEGGVIVDVLEPEVEEEAEEEVEEEAGKDKEEEMSSEPFDSAKFKDEILGAVSELIKNEIAATAFATTEKVDEVTEAVGMVTDIIEKMASAPKANPTKKVANPFNPKQSDIDIASRVATIMSANKK